MLTHSGELGLVMFSKYFGLLFLPNLHLSDQVNFYVLFVKHFNDVK